MLSGIDKKHKQDSVIEDSCSTTMAEPLAKQPLASQRLVEVAECILAKAGPMTSMKLQNLCYYSQAGHLAWDGEPLFEDPIHAWANGPVVVSLFELHRGFFTLWPGQVRLLRAAHALRPAVLWDQSMQAWAWVVPDLRRQVAGHLAEPSAPLMHCVTMGWCESLAHAHDTAIAEHQTNVNAAMDELQRAWQRANPDGPGPIEGATAS